MQTGTTAPAGATAKASDAATSRSYKAINDFLQVLMLGLTIALLIGIGAMSLAALVAALER